MAIMSTITCELSSDESSKSMEDSQEMLESEKEFQFEAFSVTLTRNENRTRMRERRVEFSDIENPKELNETTGQRRESDIMRFLRSRSPSLTSFSSCRRSQHQRLSLLGRPINYRPIKQRDPRYRTIQTALHNFLERPRGFPALSYHLLL